jgi:hypothetical protein
MKEYGEHTAQAKQLQERIGGLETTFAKGKPDAVVEAWRRATQPWSDAVQSRTQFFTPGSFTPEIDIPEGAIPKIYYKQELPKRIKALEDYAAEKQVQVDDVNCGVPAADHYGEGTFPSRDEITKHLHDYDYCSALTRLLIDAKPVSVSPLKIWTEREEKGRSGAIVKRTTGVNMQMNTQSFIRFVDKLAQYERYFTIDEFKATNAYLHQPDPLLTVDLIMTQAEFRPNKKAAAKAADPAGGAAANERLNSLFGGAKSGKPNARPQEGDDEGAISTWTKIKNFLGFR